MGNDVNCDPFSKGARYWPDGQAEQCKCPGYLPPDWHNLSCLANQGLRGKPKIEIKLIYGETEKHGRYHDSGQINGRSSPA
jgi:hypothetical protein